MLMVIFGAGASYDSAPAYPVPRPAGGQSNFGGAAPAVSQSEIWRPPLANNLFLDPWHTFGEIVVKYPKLSHILPFLRQPIGGKSIEETLESLQAEGADYPERQKEFASVRYYLCELLTKVTKEWHFLTDGTTNYTALTGELLRYNQAGEQICLVTFNYDLLLDYALHSFDFKGRSPDEFLDSHPILKVFKLHGAVDWARLADLPPHSGRLSPHQLINIADTLKLSDTFVRLNPTDPNQFYVHDRPVFPAIAIPTQTKTESTFECPPNHRQKLAEMLPSVSKILIVGWQAREAHFTHVLKSRLPKLGHIAVVGRDRNDAVQISTYFTSTIEQDYNSIVHYESPAGFTDFIVARRGHEFFSV